MMGKLGALLAPFKSQLLAFVGVLAVAGIFTSAIAAVYISKQNDTIDAQNGTIQLQAATNKQWQSNWEAMTAQRERDQQAVLDLQEQIRGIEADNDNMAAGIRNLEAGNAQVRDYLAGKLPAELKRMLERP